MTPAEIARVARLARLSIPDDQLDAYSSELTNIFAYIERLSELDTSNVEPMVQAISDQGKNLRLDRERKDPDLHYFHQHYIDLAPQSEGPFLKVPKLSG